MPNGGIQFDMTVNAGNVITILTVTITWAVTLIIGWMKFDGHVKMLDFRVSLVETAVSGIKAILETFLKQETKLAVLEAEIAAIHAQIASILQSIEHLRVGEGYIQSPRRANIDGEYKRE